MLQVRKALERLEGKILNMGELRQAFKAVMIENLKDIAPEFTMRDLYELAYNEGLITELPGPKFEFHIASSI